MSHAHFICPPERPGEFDARRLLLKTGINRTPGHVALLTILGAPPGTALRAEQIYEKRPAACMLGLTTVYRSLSPFERQGLLERQWADGDTHGKALYFLRPAAGQRPSFLRVTCRICKRSAYLEDAQMSKVLHRLAVEHGFERQLSAIAASTICNQCSAGTGRAVAQGH